MNSRRCFQFMLNFCVCEAPQVIHFYFFGYGSKHFEFTGFSYTEFLELWGGGVSYNQLYCIYYYNKISSVFSSTFWIFRFFLNCEYLLLNRKVNKQLWFILWFFSHSYSYTAAILLQRRLLFYPKKAKAKS